MEKCLGSGQPLDWPEQGQHLLHYNEPFILPWPTQSSMSSTFYPSSSSASAEDRDELSASKSHSQAEKRRRERINGHLSTLRRLIPRSDKMDKAALLGTVVNHVKELKRKANEVGKLYTVPTDIDEVSVDINNNNKDCILFKASVCCEDRPELLTDLIQAVKGLKLRPVRADMATLGGRVINVMILSTNDNADTARLSSLKQSIKQVLSRVVSLSLPSVSDFSSKRQRMLLPSNFKYSHLTV
ncbi:hypothetical protein ACHQM5_020730 [Ranunculus cassubicifolius]